MSIQQLLDLPVWQHYQPISLSEMKSVKLMNRIDTKYLMPAKLLPELLQRAAAQYRVQQVEGLYVSSYDTLYYDTPDLYMFVQHHNRHLRRQKVRVRRYLDTGQSFLEIKHKNNKGRTKKKRVELPPNVGFTYANDASAVEFLRTQVAFDPFDLQPQMHTIFNRITLVDKSLTERLTLDLNLRFVNEQTGLELPLGPLVVIELKQDGAAHSAMKDLLLSLRVHPFKMSKYCIGTVLTNPMAKHNRFKKKLLAIRKMSEQ